MVSVVPYIGTWIETNPDILIALSEEVVPYIGTWIETKLRSIFKTTEHVVPYIGTWIETVIRRYRGIRSSSRTLYRYVD